MKNLTEEMVTLRSFWTPLMKAGRGYIQPRLRDIVYRNVRMQMQERLLQFVYPLEEELEEEL